MDKKRDPKQSKHEKVEEPSKAFKIYPSFQEMEQDELKWLAGLSPREHLQHATSLIQRMFAKELDRKNSIGKHVHFNKSK